MPFTKDSAKHSNIYDAHVPVWPENGIVIGEPLTPATEITKDDFRKLEKWIIEYKNKEHDDYYFEAVGVHTQRDEDETQNPWVNGPVLKEMNTGDLSRFV